LTRCEMVMSSKGMSTVPGAISAIMVNFFIHALVLYESILMVPPNLLMMAAMIPFFPIWVAVIYGLLKLRKWGFQLGLLISIAGLILSVGGILLAISGAYFTLLFDILQITLFTYGLVKIKF